MDLWLNRGTLAGTLIGALLIGVAYQNQGITLALSGLELFFFVTTVLSLCFNIWQLVRERERHEPLKNSLIGMFNDLKDRQLRCHGRQQLLVGSVETNYQLEFWDFLEEMKHSLEQLREHIAGLLQTLDPQVSSQAIFRAAEFGLTDDEKAFRRDWVEKQKQRDRAQQASASASASGAAASTVAPPLEP